MTSSALTLNQPTTVFVVGVSSTSNGYAFIDGLTNANTLAMGVSIIPVAAMSTLMRAIWGILLYRE